MAQPPGTEFRGAMVTGRFDWVAFDVEEAVGLIVGRPTIGGRSMR
ncbi:MAG: hypothetical protein ACRDHS_05360 [Actinomycetota bacterium]